MGPRSKRWMLSILTPLITVGAAAYLTYLIPAIKERSLLLFLTAVIISTRVAGWKAGLLAILLSAGATTYFFNQPLHSFSIQITDNLLRLTTFGLVSVMILSLHAGRTRSDMALRASDQRLMLCLDTAHLGVWDYNLLNRKFWWSKTLEAIYGRTTGDFPNTYGRFFGFIHFDDQPLFNRAITRTIDEGTDYEVDHRIVLPDQSIRWVNTRGRVFF